MIVAPLAIDCGHARAGALPWFAAAALMLVVPLLTGCSSSADMSAGTDLGARFTLHDAKVDLSAVHKVYRDEFASQDLKLGVSRDGRPLGGATASPSRFPRTLAAIQGFRAQHADKPDALKHLAVLEAMIHLQSGQYGMARLAAASAAALPGTLETSDGELIRDAFFLQALSSTNGLIDAWEMMGDRNRWDARRFGTIGDTLREIASRFKAPKGDDGRLYLAATAAIVYMHAGAMASEAVASGRPQAEKDAAAVPFFRKAAAAIEPFLGDADSALNDSPNDGREVPHYQFVRVYQIAKKKAAATATTRSS